MSLVGDIQYKWSGDTRNLEKAAKQADAVLTASEKRAKVFSAALKGVGLAAGGITAVNLLKMAGIVKGTGTVMSILTGTLGKVAMSITCLLYTSRSPRDA